MPRIDRAQRPGHGVQANQPLEPRLSIDGIGPADHLDVGIVKRRGDLLQPVLMGATTGIDAGNDVVLGRSDRPVAPLGDVALLAGGEPGKRIPVDEFAEPCLCVLLVSTSYGMRRVVLRW